MDKSEKTPQEFIQYSFSPMIAVFTNTNVEKFALKNNLSFIELLQPFTSLNWEGQFREPTGSWCTIKKWKLHIRDVNWKPLQPTEARKQLNNAVLTNYHDKTTPVEIGNLKFDVPQSTIWFDAWRETYFEVQFPSDHEYTKHFVGCMVVGTSLDDIEVYYKMLQDLTVLQNVTPPKLPKWFNSDILKTFVILHDPSTVSKEKADDLFAKVESSFGKEYCFMVTINTKNTAEADKEPVNGDLWTPFIRRSDTSNELYSPQSNVTASPEAAYLSPATSPVSTLEDLSNIVSSDGHHPLTTAEFYDNANSLQNNSLTGSVESISVDKKELAECYGASLSAADVENLRQFLKDFASKALLPHFERQISLLSDMVANKKGVSRSLLSATKRWFGTGKTGSTAANNSVIYSNDCPELQLRRLGDLWFMCGQWQRAFDAYHTAKREFYADGAWLCYAGALEMAAVSAFMAGDANKKTHAYIEESITTYLTTCRMVQYAVRATLLSVLCLGPSGAGDSARQLIRMTSEDSDLRSAMLLEQAALAFLAATRALPRKYAFHMVLAGHRFSKAGQKKHAYRCYQQAYQIYQNSGWRLSCDHVQFALGRLAGGVRLAKAAACWLAGPLAPHSTQPPAQQHAFLREYMLHHQQWIETSEDKSSLPILPLPLVSGGKTVVVCGGTPPLATPRRVPATSVRLPLATPAGPACPHNAPHWGRMEEMLLQVAQGSVPMIFKPTIDLHDSTTDNSMNPIVPQGEPVQISITVINPLKIPLIMMDVELLWRFHPTDGDSFSNEGAAAAGSPIRPQVLSGQKIVNIPLDGDAERDIVFTITPLQVGELHLQGLSYKLSSGGNEEYGSSIAISGKQILEIPKRGRPGKEDDKRLQIKVVPHAPCLQMTFSEISTEVVCGQLVTLDIEFRNAGPRPLHALHVAVSHPHAMSLGDDRPETFVELYEEKYHAEADLLEERLARQASWRSACVRHVRAVSDVLDSGGCKRRTLHVRPDAEALHLLAYYSAGNDHRLLRHTINFKLQDVVKIVAVPRRYVRLTDDNQAMETMSISLEVQNDRTVRDTESTLELLEVSLLGRQWKLTDFIASRGKSDPLALHEKLHIVLRARRITETLDDRQIEWSSLKINSKYPESLPDINTPPYSKFVVDYKSSLTEDFDTSIGKQARERAGLIRSTLVARWKITTSEKGETVSAVGQTYLWLECFSDVKLNKHNNNMTLNFEESDANVATEQKHGQQKEGVVTKLRHPLCVTHDFSQRSLCVVPVDFHFVNCEDTPVTTYMNLNGKSPGLEVGWVGALTVAGGAGVELAPRATATRSAGAVVAAPGTYVLPGDTVLIVKQA